MFRDSPLYFCPDPEVFKDVCHIFWLKIEILEGTFQLKKSSKYNQLPTLTYSLLVMKPEHNYFFPWPYELIRPVNKKQHYFQGWP